MADNNFNENKPGNQVLLHDKVAALRKEREGQSRTPTPPPQIGEGRPHHPHHTSPTDFLHKKTKKKLESTPWSQQNDILSPSRSKDSNSGAGKSQLSPIASQYGKMTTMEKKTLDRTIHSLLQ